MVYMEVKILEIFLVKVEDKILVKLEIKILANILLMVRVSDHS